ncbi:hypothetical protein [Streptomyces sp. NPDC050738]|uniref:hypothetical protein n=1 Tax=Streptomyces sp. NPDC050738 TaxID=3154744 RepID=UPI00343E4110
MMLDAAYSARTLQRAGQWDAALALLPYTSETAAVRAEILVDRHTWRLDPVDEALTAVHGTSEAQPRTAAFLLAQLEYYRRMFGLGTQPLCDDPVEVFAALPPTGWAVFWWSVAQENLRQDKDAAAEGLARARALAVADGDLFLESYAVRHEGALLHFEKGDPARGLPLLRRSLNLRAACGARPQAAAAQRTLAEALGPGEESDELREISAATADELGLTWLKRAED